MLLGLVRRVSIYHPAIRPFFLTIICSTVLIFTTPVISRAAVFVVNTTADTQDLNTADGQCADATGACSLRAAITQSNATAALDVIMVPAGTYTLTLAAPSENVNAGGDLDITSPVTLEGAGSGVTIVQAHATPNTATERVFHVTASATPSGFDLFEAPTTSHHVDLGGLTIRNGHYNNNTFGAGIRISGGWR